MINETLDLLAYDAKDAIKLINTLSHADRITVRTQAELEGLPLPRNLYFDYSTQEWI